ncbi:MAG: YicC/YloC family endoribonuclease [Acetobacteraceae bacterium]|nr:YicC/YloC family endoribonuclease [Acetobacteraceae bacterium]
MSLASMTGFGRAEGSVGGVAWAWELRSVNGRGLELRLRMPTGLDHLEPGLRDTAATSLKRGNINGTLTIRREDRPRIAVDPELLSELLRLAAEISDRIPGAPPLRAESLLALPGVLRASAPEEAWSADLLAHVKEGFGTALAALVAARRGEGAKLHGLLLAQLAEVDALRRVAVSEAADQPERQRHRLLESLAGLLRDQPGLPAERIAQEVALLATRSDVREELDRLQAHIEAARLLLAEATPVGRRFDFLVQEFVREINTLCSKSASVPLTATGLRLKAVIEQMREQVQNVE